MANELNYGGGSLDKATVDRILAQQGAAPTQDNINRIMQFAASDPSVLERYSLGTAPAQIQTGPTGRYDVRGHSGLDDNSALLNLAVNNSIAKTEAAPPPGRVEVGQPTPAPAQRPRTPAPQPKRGASAVVEPSAVIPQTEQKQYDYIADPGGGTPYVVPNPPGAGEQRAGGGGLWDWLRDSIIPGILLGGGAAAAAARARGGGTTPTQTPPGTDVVPIRPPEATYVGPINRDQYQYPGRQGALPPVNPSSGAVEVQPGGGVPARRNLGGNLQNPADKARIQAEVDAENAALRAAEAQQAERLQAQMRARATTNAAKGVLTGRGSR